MNESEMKEVLELASRYQESRSNLDHDTVLFSRALLKMKEERDEIIKGIPRQFKSRLESCGLVGTLAMLFVKMPEMYNSVVTEREQFKAKLELAKEALKDCSELDNGSWGHMARKALKDLEN